MLDCKASVTVHPASLSGGRRFATTANSYSHLLQNAQSEAVEKVDEMFRRSVSKDP